MGGDSPTYKRGLFSIITSATGPVERGAAFVGAITILAMMLLTTADVIGRYVLNSPIMGAYEASEMMLIGVVFLAVAYVQSQKGHVEIEIFKGRLNKKGQTIINILGLIIGLCPLSLLTWQAGMLAWRDFLNGNHTMGLAEIPYWPAKSVLTFGIGLLCVQLVLDLISEVNKLRRVGHES